MRQILNLSVLGIESEPIIVSFLVFIASIVIALVLVYKLVRSKKNLRKAKRLYPDLVSDVKKDIKRYVVMLISDLVIGSVQLIIILWAYSQAFRSYEYDISTFN